MNERRRRFILEYLIDLNGTQAARRAGYKPTSARYTAQRLLHAPEIRRAVDAAIARRAERTEVRADRVIQQFARIAFADARQLWDWDEKDGLTLKRPSLMSEDDAAAVASIAVRRSKRATTTRVSLHDRTRALTALARHLGLFTDRPVPDTAARYAETEALREKLLRRVKELTEEQAKDGGSGGA